MRNFKKFIAGFIAMLSLLVINPMQANAAWKQDSTGWWYTSGSSYLTGWQSIDGNWYYFYSNGYMAHDCWIGNYYLNSSGAWTLDVPKATNDTISTASTSSSTATSDTVYVSSKGIYHKTPNAHGMKNSTAMTRAEAEAAGYRACQAKHCP